MHNYCPLTECFSIKKLNTTFSKKHLSEKRYKSACIIVSVSHYLYHRIPEENTRYFTET